MLSILSVFHHNNTDDLDPGIELNVRTVSRYFSVKDDHKMAGDVLRGLVDIDSLDLDIKEVERTINEFYGYSKDE